MTRPKGPARAVSSPAPKTAPRALRAVAAMLDALEGAGLLDPGADFDALEAALVRTELELRAGKKVRQLSPRVRVVSA